MGIAIKPYTPQHIQAVQEFNQRLEAGGVAREFQFPEEPTPRWLPKLEGRHIYQEFFLALEGDLVRGGYIIKQQNFSFEGKIQAVGYYHHPISEGIINKAYVGVGVQMLRSALERQPWLFALGMNSYHHPLPRMLKRMGWAMWSVPFYFKVNHPVRFLREVRILRKTAFRRMASDVAALTGIGWLILKASQALQGVPRAHHYGISVERVRGFTAWADDLWQRCHTRYKMIALRNSATLSALYPITDGRFLCLRIRRHGTVIGWVVVLDTLMHDQGYFGNLRVGTNVDCLAAPEHASAVIEASAGALEDMGVDLSVSNQSHFAWCAGLKNAGYLRGPSNFILATSKKLTEALAPLQINVTRVHLNRGDGDGPIHL